MKDIETANYIKGKDVVLILTGLGGSVKGSQNKYETIANNIITKYDFSVFVAATPQGACNYYKGVVILCGLLVDTINTKDIIVCSLL